MAPLRDIPLKPGAPGFNQAWSATAIALALLLIVLGALGLKRSEDRFAELSGWRVHTLVVLDALGDVLEHTVEAESAARGYALTGVPDRKAEWLRAKAGVAASLDEVQRLTADNPAQQARILELREDLKTRMALLDTLGDARDQEGVAGAVAVSLTGAGVRTMASVRAIQAQMVAAEQALLVAREQRAKDGRVRANRAIVLYAVFAFLLGLGGSLLLLRGRREHQRLEAEQKRLLQILEETPDFIGMATVDGRSLYQNRALRRLRGLADGDSLEALSPIALAGFYAPESLPSLQSAMAGAALGRSWAGEHELLDAQGTSVPVAQVILPHRDALGRVTHISTVARDIRAQKATERLKDEFVATVSHELRTPLTSIKGALGLVSGGAAGPVPEAMKALLGIAVSNTDRLIRLINDILDIGKIEAGKLEFNVCPLNLDEITAQALESTTPYFDQLGVEMRWEPGALDGRIAADEGRLVQVLVNLLSNAAKFSPKDEPVLVRTLRIGGQVRVEVVNGGPGIPEVFRDRMFQKFAQADASDRRAQSGSGLGLSIAKALTERMGGSLGFESVEGRTCFWVMFPEWLAAAPSMEGPDPDGKPRILLCEDDADVAAVVRMAMEWDGYAVDIAPSVAGARTALNQRTYAALVLDLILPDGDGLDLLRELKTREETRGLPVVVASVRADDARREVRGQALEVLGWLSKPMDTRDLTRLLEPELQLYGQGARILHVEDDPDVATLTAQTLAPLGAVITARNLAEGRRLLLQGTYALALLDVRLPDGSGLDLIPELLALDPRPRIVLFSAEEQSSEVIRKLDAALVKTQVGGDELLAALRGMLARHKP